MSDETETDQLRRHSRMLGVIASHVEGFARDEEDTTLVCVLRLLREYHYAKAELAGKWIEKEEGKNEW
jgi:hypothetical protein